MKSRLRYSSYVLACFAASFAIACSGAGATGDGTQGDDDASADGSIDVGATDGAPDSTTSDSGASSDSAKDTSTSGDSTTDSGASTDTGVTDTGATTTDSGAAVDTASSDTGLDDTATSDTGSSVDTGAADVGFPLCTVDSDGDGIFDEVEGRLAGSGPVDTDGDGTPDYLDLDSDDDGIPDAVEMPDKSCTPGAYDDADGDGTLNFRDLDSDGNGLLDHDEGCASPSVLALLGAPSCTLATTEDLDGDGVLDFLDADNDHDARSSDLTIGLEDSFELRDESGAYVGLIDTDADGIPDVWDRDSDGDNLFDLDDGLGDPDHDGTRNFRDVDSDGDKVPDVCEARANPDFTLSYAEASKAIFDTDGDGKADFLDTDTDSDLLADSLEDKNGNCVVDTGETDRLKADTDGDGVSDLIEVTLVSEACADDPSCTPAKSGKFYFIEPYSPDGSAAPSPTSTPLAMSTTLNQADVAFVVDTTTSMDGIESNLSSSIASRIIPGLTARIPDLELGVIGYDDALAKPWGDSTGDSFIWFPNGYATGSAMGTASNATTAASLLTHTSPGGSYPEGSIPALWWAMTGDSFSFHSCTTCGYPATTKSFAAAPAPDATHFGGLHFRKGALPILINTSDANMNDGKTTGCNVPSGTTAIPSSLCFPISYGATGAQASSLGHSPSIDELVTQMNSVGAQYIGVSVHGPGGSRSSDINRTLDASYYASAVDMLYIARGTSSKVPPSVLGGTTSDCKTNNPGATVLNPADSDGQCPLVFDITYTGSGLGDLVVTGVVALLDAIKFDVHVQAIPVVSGGVDPVDAFMSNVLPMPGGGTDPVTGGVCVTFASSSTADKFVGPKATSGTDGANETILQVNPGPLYCFAVTPKANTTVVATTSPQVFHASLRVLAEKPGGTFALGADRDVLFLVPPIVN